MQQPVLYEDIICRWLQFLSFVLQKRALSYGEMTAAY